MEFFCYDFYWNLIGYSLRGIEVLKYFLVMVGVSCSKIELLICIIIFIFDIEWGLYGNYIYYVIVKVENVVGLIFYGVFDFYIYNV